MRCTQKRPIVVRGIGILSQIRQQEIRPSGFRNLQNIMKTGPQVSVYSASMPEVRTDMREGVSRAP